MFEKILSGAFTLLVLFFTFVTVAWLITTYPIPAFLVFVGLSGFIIMYITGRS